MFIDVFLLIKYFLLYLSRWRTTQHKVKRETQGPKRERERGREGERERGREGERERERERGRERGGNISLLKGNTLRASLTI